MRPQKPGSRRGGPKQAQSGAEIAAYRTVVALYQQNKFEEALKAVNRLLSEAPRYADAWNLMGIMLNNLSRPREAIAALEQARHCGTTSVAPLINLAKSHLMLGEIEKSADVARSAIRLDPRGVDGHLALARARMRGGDAAGALQALQLALIATPKSAELRGMRARLLSQTGRHADALKDLDIVLKLSPSVMARIERSGLLSKLGRAEEGLRGLEQLLSEHPGNADVLLAMAQYYFHEKEDRPTANEFYRRSLEARFDSRTAGLLVFSLLATRGPEEAANVEAAHDLTVRCIDESRFDAESSSNFVSALVHTADFGRLSKIDQWGLAGYWARTNVPGALHGLLSRVETRADRVRLLDLHRLWGDLLVKKAAMAPPLPALRRDTHRKKIRVGLMSSDLRHHPVSYFALPIFEHYDPSLFELYAYSFYPKAPDRVQEYITSKTTVFRTLVGGSDWSVARQMIEDELDIIFEFGGSTHLNRISVLAHRVAPIQASWLGYPNSIGLPTIDRILVDPYIKPAPDLLVEQPFEMPQTWVTLGRIGFNDQAALAEAPPLIANGHVTFGTANNPMKYTPRLLALWSRVLQEVPGSRFLFIRPEGAVPAFSQHIITEFAANGIDGSRISFRPVRGQHLPHYNEIDIALDCVPHTGGTTTCECLWMGVPVVTKAGEAFYERLSLSNLSNAGLGDLCVSTDDGYVRTAVALASDRPRLVELKKELRTRVRRSPLCDEEGWVRAWQDEIRRLVAPGAWS